MKTFFAVLAFSLVAFGQAPQPTCDVVCLDRMLAMLDRHQEIKKLLADDSFGQLHPTMPDPALTPGATDPRVTQANIHQTICKSGYTKTVRNVTEAEKRDVMQRYGLPLSDLHLVEIDHFYSLELAGSNAVENLWPQFYDGPSGYLGARAKDVVETHEKTLVCKGSITLEQAHADIRNWVNIYLSLKLKKK